jgi:hypothetical protein
MQNGYGLNITEGAQMIKGSLLQVVAMASAVTIFSISSVVADSGDSILEWLESIGLEKYEEDFRRNDITLDILPELTDSDFRDMGIRSLGARKRLLKAIAETPYIAQDTHDESTGEIKPDKLKEGKVGYSEGPCERPTLPNVVDLSQIPQKVKDDIGRHLDTPLAKPFRPSLLTYLKMAGPNWELSDETIYTIPPYTIYRRTQEWEGRDSLQIGIYLPGNPMSLVATGDYGWSREHIDFLDFEYIEPDVDVEIDGISSRDISVSFTWNMLIIEGANSTASRHFTEEGWVTGSKEVEIEINGESFRLKGFVMKLKTINQQQVYVRESTVTWVPHIGHTVEWKTTKERWSGGSRSHQAVDYSNFRTTPEVMTYLRCVEAAG